MTRPHTVHLGPGEISVARFVWEGRIAAARAKRLRPAHGAPEGQDGEILHMMGAFSEMAVAKYLNLYWSGGIGIIGGIDVGEMVEVRSITQPTYRLFLHEKDRALPFVLVYPKAVHEYRLIGWIRGHDGKRDAFRDPKPRKAGERQWAVPQSALLDMEDLRRWVSLQRVGETV